MSTRIGTNLAEVWRVLYAADPDAHLIVYPAKELLVPLVEYTGYVRWNGQETAVRLVPDDQRFPTVDMTTNGRRRNVRELAPVIEVATPDAGHPDPFTPSPVI